jgi:hypothetical protein
MRKDPEYSNRGGRKTCGVVFGLIFVSSGISMIRTGKGWLLLLKVIQI